MTVQVQTAPLPAGFPTFRIDRQYPDAKPAFFLFDARNSNVPLIVDRYGDIRWYLLVDGTKYGLQILRNGNIGFGLAEQSMVAEYTMLASSWISVGIARVHKHSPRRIREGKREFPGDGGQGRHRHDRGFHH